MKIIKIMAAVFICLNVFAQITPNRFPVSTGALPAFHPVDNSQVAALKNQWSQHGRALQSIVLDYDAVDELTTLNLGGDYTRFIWELDSRFNVNDQSIFGLHWGVVVFDTLYDANTGIPYPYSSTSVKVDSLHVLISHQNVTGTYDSIHVSVYQYAGTLGVTTNNNNITQTGQQITNTVLYDTLIRTNTSLTPPSTVGVLTIKPRLQLSTGQKFVVGVHCYGDTANTFYLLAGYGNRCGGSCYGYPSVFDLTSIYRIIAWGGTTNLTGVNSLAYDCNQNGSAGEPAECEEFALQNFGIQAYVTINATFSASITAAMDACPGETVSLSVTPVGGTPPYTVSWSPTTGLSNPFSATTNATVNATTTYTATITQSGGGSITKTVTVTVRGITVNAGTDRTIGCGQTTNLAATISGSTTGATYQWSNGVTTASNPGVGAGTYTITVTNNYGCSATDAVMVSVSGVSQSLSFSVNVNNNIGCRNSAITFTNTSTHLTNWSWIWDFGDGSLSFTQNASHAYSNNGVYIVTLGGDTANCSSSSTTKTLTIQTCAQIGVTISGTTTVCAGQSTTLTASVTNQTGTVSYLWSTGATNSSITVAPASTTTYSVTVSDQNGSATASKTVTVNSLTVTLSKTDATCNQSNGSVTSSVSGGSGYTYSWSNGSTSANLSNIAAGTYSVTVTASNGCTGSSSATVNTTSGNLSATTSVTVSPNCGQSNGSAMVSASGGAGGYTYHWSTGSTSSSISSIAAGAYTVTVTDAGGCTVSVVANVNNSGGATVVVQSQSNVSCNGGSNGSVTVVVSGGTAPYNYSMNGTNFQSSATFSGLTAGSYNFYARDANLCLATTGTTITQPNPISISITKTDVNCFGNNTGTATANVSGGTPQYNYTWSNSQSGLLALNLAAGPYTLIITDAANCTASSSVTITQPAAALSSPVNVTDDVSCNGGNDGAAAVSASGGTTPYSYQWSNGENTSSASGFAAGACNITVTDSKGCTSTGTGTITQPLSLSVTTSVTNVDCKGASSGSISTSVTGGTSPYSYNWSLPGASPVLNAIEFGVYGLTVTDNNGCTATILSTVTEPSLITVTTATVKASSATAHDGSATATVTGGTQPYSYAWSSGSTSAASNGIGTGNYNVTITDNNNCTASASAFVDFETGISGTNRIDGNITFYPNPTSGMLFVDIELKKQQDVKIEVMNLVGAVIISKSFSRSDKINTAFDLNAYAEGIYFIRLRCGEASITQKAILTNR